MFRSILQWNFKIDDKEFNLYLDGDSPLTSVKEVANQIISHCVNMEAQLKAKHEAEKATQEKENKKHDIEPVQDEATAEA